jgi:hypothetical protein
MVAPAVIVLIIIAVIAVLMFIIALALLISAANQESGTDKTSLLAAGAMIGIAIPHVIVGALFGVLYFNGLQKGQKKAGLMWLFIILSGLGALVLIISSIIAFVVGGRLFDSDRQRNVRAAGAMALIGGLLFAIALVILLVMSKKGMVSIPSRKKVTSPSK